MKVSPEQALKMAIGRAGGARKVAQALRIRTQGVYEWRICPPHRVLQLEKLSGIPREQLRPDYYAPAKSKGKKNLGVAKLEEELGYREPGTGKGRAMIVLSRTEAEQILEQLNELQESIERGQGIC